MACMTTDAADSAVPQGDYLRSLPIGEELVSRTAFFDWEVCPYELDEDGRLRIKKLEPPVLPEPPRGGEDGPEDCWICEKPDSEYLWTDEHWRVTAPRDRGGVPAVLLLEPRTHADLRILPAERSVELGPMIQRVERALATLDDVGRVHLYRWGDGMAHLHLWFVVRPAGMMQMRGAFLPVWDGILPTLPDEHYHAVNMKLAAALEKDGGQAHVR
jgi:diadenosine tetraphosphate (Ap4A) HIT family hydrolase